MKRYKCVYVTRSLGSFTLNKVYELDIIGKLTDDSGDQRENPEYYNRYSSFYKFEEVKEDMKITGYKLLKPYPGLEVGKVYDKHEHQGDVEWFEVQYEEEIEHKIGDLYYGHLGDIKILKSLKPETREPGCKYYLTWEGSGSSYDKNSRLIPKYEIITLSKKPLAGYSPVYSKEGVQFGCNFYSKEDVQQYIKLMLSKKSSVKGLQIYNNDIIDIGHLSVINARLQMND